MKNVLLVGNPNCGKSTLFNALTGDNQRVGNWAGVTVEKKTGYFKVLNQELSLTDLPGIYSLDLDLTSAGEDERISAKVITDENWDILVNVIDACNLERHLYLTSQLLELEKPIIVALNMMDIATDRGISIDTEALSILLGCPVVALQAHQSVGVLCLKQQIISLKNTASALTLPLNSELLHTQASIASLLTMEGKKRSIAGFSAWRLMAGDELMRTHASETLLQALSLLPLDCDMLIADARYQAIHQLIKRVLKKTSDATDTITAKIDKVVLHRFWALPIFLMVMYVLFLFAINIGGAFQDFFDLSTTALFIDLPASLFKAVHAPTWISALIANGIGGGINTTLTFIPVMAAMYFFLAFLEASGYMARAAFVVDKIMRLLGLPGKSFVPMIVGFGCNVPAIMAARTLDSKRDKTLTVLMSPFMSCSARLAIYAVFVAAFFPTGGQNIVFSLYMIGIVLAVLTGLLLRNSLLMGSHSPLILELPAYHRPSLTRLLKETHFRLKHFIRRAGKLIIPTCILLGGLNSITLQGHLVVGEAGTHSVLSWFGQCLTPLFAPMGISPDNWPATVGLLTGMLAKEVVIGSLNALYTQLTDGSMAFVGNFHLMQALQEAALTIPSNLMALSHAFINPILAATPDNHLSKSFYGAMVQRFDGQIGAYAYLLFILLYIPCISTMAAIRQETSRHWMWFSVGWSLFVAYFVAVVFYQLATINAHYVQTLLWCALFIISVALFIKILRRMGEGGRDVISAA